MFKKVIVGIDGADGGVDALALARLLSADETELTLVSIYPREPVAWRGASADYQAALSDEAARVLQQAAEEAGVSAAHRVHGASDVGRGLHEVAEEIGADLIVVGSSRKGHFGRVFSGDDTRHALHGAASAVAVAPAGYIHWDQKLDRVGVGYDGSPESEEALKAAQELAREKGASVAAMEVLYFPTRYFVGPAYPDHTTVMKMIEDSVKRLGEIPGVEPHAVSGIPGEELARFSETVDVIIVGSREYGPRGRLAYGNVGQELARAARSPLIVLPKAAGEAESASPEAGVANAAA